MCAGARLFYVAVKASNESVPQARQPTRVCLKILSKMEYSPEFTQANTILEEDFQADLLALDERGFWMLTLQQENECDSVCTYQHQKR